ncbi:methyltransferase domain-containing protein [Neisseriaceae bacterium PsAf]|nr:methyltransferase domain-containing protein [Neisseriaceae bacterium PsAf]MCV2502668.1 protein-L-isoaspartate O-methyltransferase [Neisseriaceae bacterium]
MDFEKARYNMVEQQIRPWGVLDLTLLDVLSDIPREKFVLPDQLEIAYAELALPLKNGSVMLEPKMVARLIQSLELNPEKDVLEIGTGSGYATAILSKLAKQVDTLDKDPEQLEFAKSVLDELDLDNIEYYAKNGLSETTYQEIGKQYDAIYIGGAVHYVPSFLLSALKPNGKLIAIVGETPIMHATIYNKNGSDITEQSLFETNVHYLQENSNTISKKFLF